MKLRLSTTINDFSAVRKESKSEKVIVYRIIPSCKLSLKIENSNFFVPSKLFISILRSQSISTKHCDSKDIKTSIPQEETDQFLCSHISSFENFCFNVTLEIFVDMTVYSLHLQKKTKSFV